MKRLAGILAALILSAAGLVAVTAPAQASTSQGSFKICNSSNSWTSIQVFDTDDSTWHWQLAYNGACTDYRWPAGVRVDTDPYGGSHSYRIKAINVATGAGSYGPCHENSDNASSDPPNPPSTETWKVYYWNFDDGYCKVSR